jgi:hypothetical protein
VPVVSGKEEAYVTGLVCDLKRIDIRKLSATTNRMVVTEKGKGFARDNRRGSSTANE